MATTPDKRNLIQKYPGAMAAVVLLFGFALITFPLWIGSSHEVFDAYQFFAPYYTLVSNLIQGGDILLWNPWSNGGMPDFAEPQLGASSPVTLLFAAVFGASQWAFCIYWLAIWILGGLGMLYLGRHWGVSPWAGLVAALAYVFSGFHFGHSQHTSVIYSMAFLPFIIVRLEAGLGKNGTIAAIQAGVLWGLSAIGGNPSITIAETLLFALWGFCGPAFQKEKIPFARRFRCLAILAITGAVVMAPVYFGFLYEGKGFSFRSDSLSMEVASATNPLHPQALSTLFSPNFLTLQAVNGFWEKTDMTTTCTYIGAGSLFLVVLGCFRSPKKHWPFYAAIVLFFLFSFGFYTPFYGWLYAVFPPIRFSRQAGMLRGMAIFLLIVAGMWASVRLVKKNGTPLWSVGMATASTLLALIAVGVTCAVFFSVKERGNNFAFSILHVCLIWGGIIILSWVGIRKSVSPFHIFIPLTALAFIDAGMTAQLNRFFWRGEHNLDRGQKVAPLKDYPQSVSFNRNYEDKSSELLYYGGASLSNYTAFKNTFHEALVKTKVTSQFALTGNRIWFSPEMPLTPLSQEALDRYLLKVTQAQGVPVLIRHSRQTLLNPHERGPDCPDIDKLPAAVPAQTTVVEYHPNSLKLRVNAPEAGWVCVTDRWSRSWTCSVNGKPVPVEGANFIFRATPVSKGVNEIEYRFEPRYFFPLLALSWGVMFVVGIISLRRWVIGMKLQRTTSPA